MSSYHKYLKYRQRYLKYQQYLGQQAGRCEAFHQDDCSINPKTGRCHQVEVGEGDQHCVCNYQTERCVLSDLLPGTTTRLRAATDDIRRHQQDTYSNDQS